MGKRKVAKTADTYVRSIVDHNANMLVPHYLMACYAYYVMDNPIISDELFDHITKRLIKEYDGLTHWHKEHITMDDLIAGTGYALVYPVRTVGAAQRLSYMHEHGELR
jgi:hypothetical protein